MSIGQSRPKKSTKWQDAQLRKKRALQIVESLNLKYFLVQYGIQFNKQGFALCPFHKEDTASFRCQGAWFHCFGCGINGTLLTFVERYFNLDCWDALRKIEHDFHLGLPVERLTDFGARHRSAKAVDGRFKNTKEAERTVERAEAAYKDAFAEWQLARDFTELVRSTGMEDAESAKLYPDAVWKEEKRLERLKLAEANLLEVKKDWSN